MALDQIYIVCPESIQTHCQFVSGTLSVPGPDFGCNDHLVPERLQGLAELFLAVAIHMGGIKKPYAQFKGMPDDESGLFWVQSHNRDTTKPKLCDYNSTLPKPNQTQRAIYSF